MIQGKYRLEILLQTENLSIIRKSVARVDLRDYLALLRDPLPQSHRKASLRWAVRRDDSQKIVQEGF